MNKKLTRVKKFVQEHPIEIVSVGVIVLGQIAMYYIGKSNGKIYIEPHFYPKGQAPVHLPTIQVR